MSNMQVQRCTLLSIKTGGCPETCNYCAQSSSWSKDVGLKAEKLMDLDSVYEVTLASILLMPSHAQSHHVNDSHWLSQST